MKLIFSYEFPFRPLGYGGGHQVILGLARELARQGHDVHVCCSGYDELDLASEEVPVRFHFGGTGGRWSGFGLAWRTVRLAREVRPDLVCCFTSEAAFAIPASRVLGIPTAMYLAAPELPSFRFVGWSTVKRLRFQLDLFLQFLGARLADSVMVLSGFSARQAQQHWRIPPDRLSVVPVGLEPAFLRPVDAPRGLGPGGPRFLSIGRLELAQKPLDRVADALAGLPLAWQHWTIVGSGAGEPALRARVEQVGLAQKTRFLGTRRSSEIVDLLAEQDIVLLPSTHESFFITVYEAAARGKVIVTNDVAEIRDYFDAERSVVIAPDASVAAYAASIRRAVEKFDSLQSGAMALSLRVRQGFAWQAAAERFSEAVTGPPTTARVGSRRLAAASDD